MTKRLDDSLILDSVGASKRVPQGYLSLEQRFQHLLLLGTTVGSKTKHLLPKIIEQDLKNKKHGVTIITHGGNMAMFYFAMARRAGREVILIHHEETELGKQFLKEDIVVDYGHVITRRKVVIVDMGFETHGKKAVLAVGRLLSQLKQQLLRVNRVRKALHFLHVESAERYFPFIQPFLQLGADNSFGVTMTLNSRKLLTKLEQSLLESYVQNMVILNQLAVDDVTYLTDKIYEKERPHFLNRQAKEFIYLTYDKEGRRTVGGGEYLPIEDETIQSLFFAIPRYQGTMAAYQSRILDGLIVHRTQQVLTTSAIIQELEAELELNLDGFLKSILLMQKKPNHLQTDKGLSERIALDTEKVNKAKEMREKMAEIVIESPTLEVEETEPMPSEPSLVLPTKKTSEEKRIDYLTLSKNLPNRIVIEANEFDEEF